MKNTATYEAAYEKSGEAIKAFRAVQIAYRTRIIGDAEFLAAKAVYAAAMAEYDAVYAVEMA